MASATADLTEGGALQQYILLSKNAKGKACSALISQALAAPNVLVFGELLDMPNVQQLVGTEEQKMLDLLKIFAYGSWADYKANAANLPPLNPSQTKKLKQLSIVTLASRSRLIPYSVLQEQLEIVALRDLEDLIIEAIYQGVIQGSLDQKKQQLEVEFTMGRDIKPESLDNMLAVLRHWSNQSDALLATIKDKVQHANFMNAADKQHKEEFEKKVEAVKKNLKASMESELLHAAEYESEYFGEERSRKGRAKMKGHRDHPSSHPPHQRDRKGM